MNQRAARERRGPNYYAGDLRRDLLDGALEVIAREGPGAVSLRSVARRLGVSHAAPANHFANKTALFTAIAVEGFRLLRTDMSEAAGALGPAAGALDRFRATGMAYMHFALEHPGHFAVMWRTDLLDPADAELRQAGEAALTVLLEAVHAAQIDGWAREADGNTLAYFAWSTVHGLASLWMAGTLREAQDRPFDALSQDVLTLFAGRLSFDEPLPKTHSEGNNT